MDQHPKEGTGAHHRGNIPALCWPERIASGEIVQGVVERSLRRAPAESHFGDIQRDRVRAGFFVLGFGFWGR